MREIKFRAWSKSYSHMINVGVIDFKNKFIYGTNNIDYDFEDITFLQYTGLKDSNGVEIYEGDIIQNTYFAYDGKSYDLASVIFENGEFKMNKCGGYSLAEFISKADYLKSEVIGNIYENKELLK